MKSVTLPHAAHPDCEVRMGFVCPRLRYLTAVLSLTHRRPYRFHNPPYPLECHEKYKTGLRKKNALPLETPHHNRYSKHKTSKNDYVLRQFLIDLNDKVSNGETNIGFLYSYKSGEEHYLIDGQQRFTTLILLLHYITVKENATSHEEYVSMHRIDKNISAFSYRVRSQTDSFLKNLLMSSAITSKMIKRQKWYKSIYEDDFTIHSMMDALDVIDDIWNTLLNLSSQTVLNLKHLIIIGILNRCSVSSMRQR